MSVSAFSILRYAPRRLLTDWENINLKLYYFWLLLIFEAVHSRPLSFFNGFDSEYLDLNLGPLWPILKMLYWLIRTKVILIEDNFFHFHLIQLLVNLHKIKTVWILLTHAPDLSAFSLRIIRGRKMQGIFVFFACFIGLGWTASVWLWALISNGSAPYKFCFYCTATYATSHVLQSKLLNKCYSGCYSFTSVHRQK